MKNTRKKIFGVILGLVVILVGVSYAAEAMGYEMNLSSFLFPGWWTVFLIVPGVVGLFDKNSGKVFPAVLIAVGATLLLSHYVEFNIWRWLVPAVIIAAGVSIVAGAFTGRKDDSKDEKNSDGDDGSAG